MKSHLRLNSLFWATVLSLLVPHVSFAQKTEDSVRFALTEPISVVDAVYDASPENGMFRRQVMDTLLIYDENKSNFLPLLAKTWKRVSPTVIEFELRDDVKFHNGDTVNADDIVYTIQWLSDPKSKVPNPSRFNWIAGAEKIDEFKVRLTSTKVNATDLLGYATLIPIYDENVLRPLENKFDYGRAPVGSGPFKILQVDSNKGIVAERNEQYHHGPSWMRAAVKTVRGLPIPDRDAQIANLITGGVDVILDPTQDQLKQLAMNPSLEITSLDAFYMLFLQFDSINRSGHKELQDPRVREALMMAINRQELVRTMVPGGQNAKLMDAMCFREMLACDYSTSPPAFDPEGAKKLLAEAGYPDGFDLALTARPITKDSAVAIVGYWRKIGINASVDFVTYPGFTKKRASGQMAAYFGERPFANLPDASYGLEVNFAAKSRDYWNDPFLLEATAEGKSILDLDERKALYRKAFDLINTQYYMMPISSLPQNFVHTKDLKVTAARATPFSVDIGAFSWR